MSKQISIRCTDDFAMGCYRAEPVDAASGAIVVIQEIFGVNTHIREVADGYAASGYSVYAPKLFDRIRPDIELGYSESDMAQGIDLAFNKLDLAQVINDVQATVDRIIADGEQKIGLVGFCFGGLVSWLPGGLVNCSSFGLLLWWSGGLVAWLSFGLVAWWPGGLAVCWSHGLVAWLS